MTFTRFLLAACFGRLMNSPRTPRAARSRALAVGLGLCLSGLAVRAMAQNYTPATKAFDNSPVCSDSDLGNNSDEARGNPEWKPVNGLTIDPLHPVLNDKPTILEGFVPFPPANESSKAQAFAEVSEEDLPWNHYTHDFTFQVVPDQTYQHLLSSWVRFPGVTLPNVPDPFCSSLGGSFDGTNCVVPPEICPDLTTGTTCHHTQMEVEWDSASLMDEGEGFQRIWGAVPEFVWPAVGDRVWVEGRWIFDCGHPGVPAAAAVRTYVKYSTEIHPPRALVAFRLNHPALDSFPVPRTSAPNFPAPQSYLPVTGEPATTLPPGVPNSGPTNVPVTEADIYVSGNGGGANDLCMILALNGSNCVFGHTSPVLPVNSRNYAFDIYPPGTDYNHPISNGTFPVTPPVPDASLQWRTVDHSSELPAHACGGPDTSGCVSAVPIFCLLDASTPPPDPDPDKADTSCPAVVPAQPTRLRVILPFATDATHPNANYFAQSILLGWDDVPAPATINRVVRTFKVTLHAFTVVDNGETIHDGDWRVFVNVGGQYRYISPLFDGGPGNNACNGDALTDNGDDDCFLFENTPWFVSVQDGTPIHVAVGGWESDPVDSAFCRQFPPGGDCDPFSFGNLVDLAFENNDRIGTYEFDLREQHDYQWVSPNGSSLSSFTTESTDDGERYKVEFRVEEVPAATAPASAPLGIGTPHFGQFVSSATPLALGSAAPDAQGFQYRSYLQGAPLPTYASTLSFPVHWTHADLPAGSQSVPVFLTGADGPNLFQYSAESFGNLLEPRHTATVILDNTPPVIGFVQPQATAYPHSAVLTLGYSISDGTGSGVASFTPTMDTLTTLFGHGLASGQAINLLTELKLGPHTFSVAASDNVNNADASSVTFTIIVTPESIKGDVTQFLAAGKIKNQGIALALLGPLNAAAKARASGSCAKEKNVYQPLYRAFINELKALSGKGVDPTAAQIMIADAQYLIANCP
jgi:hypothetical protein